MLAPTVDSPTPDPAPTPSDLVPGQPSRVRSTHAAVLRWLAFAAAVVVNLVVLYAPNPGPPPPEPGIDKVVHAAVFALLAFTGLRAGLRPHWFLPVVLAHAVASELVQGLLLAERNGDPVDAVADFAGTALGWLAHLGVSGMARLRR
jgi:hypothetical protein